MKHIRTPAGRHGVLLDAGERLPADVRPNWALRQRDGRWYRVYPTPDPQNPRDPATGDMLPRGNERARSARMDAKTTGRHENERAAGLSGRAQKRSHAAAKTPKRSTKRSGR